MASETRTVEDLWEAVPGQEDAVRRLRSAVDNPTHAYLISGPPGSGKTELATAFAAALLSRDATDEEATRIASRVAAGDHGGLVTVERQGPFITAEDARGVIERAARSPLEGPLQIILMSDFHLVRDAGPMLLKSIEEPPASTMFILLAEELPNELETIASRCLSIYLDAVPTETLRQRLLTEGVDPETAERAAVAAGGNIERARLLARDPTVEQRRELWYRAPERLDGRGARACEIVDELLGSIDELKAPLAEMEAEEIAAAEARAEATGMELRKTEISRLKERYKRAARRMQTDELRVGLAVLVGRYRDDMVAGGDPERFLRACEEVQQLCDDLVFNVSEQLALQSLMMSLPRLPE